MFTLENIFLLPRLSVIADRDFGPKHSDFGLARKASAEDLIVNVKSLSIGHTELDQTQRAKPN